MIDESQVMVGIQDTMDILAKQSGLKVLFGFLVLIIGIAVSRIVIQLTDKLLKKVHGIDPSLHMLLKNAMKIVLYFLCIILAAATMGIPVTSLVALFSVIGLAVSLAVQGVLSNLAGGMIILGSKPFVVGDFIETDSVCGMVKDFGFLHTKMVAPDGKMIFVPNSMLYASRLINYTVTGQRRVELTVSASYECTPNAVREAVMDAISRVNARPDVGNVLSEPAPQMILDHYADSAVVYTVWVWVNSSDFMRIKSTLNEEMYYSFKRNNVAMTYPHLNVHVS